MATPVLVTKLYIPPPRPNVILRPRLIERLNEGLQRKLTLISAPAGFGKTTLAATLVAGTGRQVAWLSLDEEDNDVSRFLMYLIAALQTVAPRVGAEVMAILQSPQPPASEAILTTLLNDISTIGDQIVLVLDDYHVIDARPVDHTLTFLLEHLPPHLHLVIATREDPPLPLARLRAGNQLSELRATDLRFTGTEVAELLNLVMHLGLSNSDIAALEERTEGWIAGLQLAAISMQGLQDTARFIKSFTGSHHFVMDYLVTEVLQRQPTNVQTFLLHTSILDRLCGPLCDAVLRDPTVSGQATLEYLEHANLFIVPLDNERRWYRYHHLFADLLRQRLQQSAAPLAGDEGWDRAELHLRASRWYEENSLDIEAFQHAAAANDIERAEHLIAGKGIPLHLRGAVKAILNWLESLPPAVLNARPWLWWRYASLLLVNGQTTGVEEKLDAAETALCGSDLDDQARNIIGQVAAARSVLALTQYRAETMQAQSRRALKYLHPSNLSVRATANWTLAYSYIFEREYAAARAPLAEAISLSRAAGDIFTTILATIGLGQVQEADNQLPQAAETYRHILQLAGDQPLQFLSEVHLGLARILYEWNDLDAAEQHGQQSLYLARQYERGIDRFIIAEVFLAQLRLARGDPVDAAALLAQADQSARRQNFVYRIPEIAAAQVLTLLRQGKLAVAAHLAHAYKLPLSQARIYLAQGNTSAALATLEAWGAQIESKGWQDQWLRLMVLQAVAHYASNDTERAVQVLGDALALAEPGGFIRLFVDEGALMAQLLVEAAARGIMPDYVDRLLAVFGAVGQKGIAESSAGVIPPEQPLIEPLSLRELEVLELIAQGLSNREISDRLFLALDTIKGHNRKIFEKLQVQRRTEAVAKARFLKILSPQ